MPSMPKLHKLIDLNAITPAVEREIRFAVNVRDYRALVRMAKENGEDLGKRPETQRKNAFKYFAGIINSIFEDNNQAIQAEYDNKIASKRAEKSAKKADKEAMALAAAKAKAVAAKAKAVAAKARATAKVAEAKNVFWTSKVIFHCHRIEAEKGFASRDARMAAAGDAIREASGMPFLGIFPDDVVRKMIKDRDVEGIELINFVIDFKCTSRTQRGILDQIIEKSKNLRDSYDTIVIIIISRDDTRHVAQPTNIMKEPLRMSYAVDLDGLIKNEEWCKNDNMCVPDWLMKKYGQTKGHIKSVKSADVIEYYATHCFDKYIHPETQIPYITNHPNRDGYTLENIKLFCENTGKTLIALHNGEIIVDIRNEKCEDPLIIECKNNHIYPITDNSKIRSLAHVNQRGTFGIKKDKKEAKPKELRLVHVKKEGDSISFLIKMIMQEKTQPYGQKIIITNDRLHNFDINGTTYCSTEFNQHIKDFCERSQIRYEGQPVQHFLTQFINKLPSSKLNEETRNALYVDGVKHRTHFGAFRKHIPYEMVGMDINKHYRNVMENPHDDWMTIAQDEEVRVVDSFTGEFGLWFIETDDMTLLHRSNWYSNSSVQQAKNFGIYFNVKYFIKGTRNPKTLISDIINELATYFDSPALTKLAINSISGCLGRTKHVKTCLSIDNNVQRVWDTFMKHKRNLEEMVYYTQEGVHVYGSKKSSPLLCTNLPMYIQILDWANINLDGWIRKFGGYDRLVFRKTDEFVMERVYGTEYNVSEDVGGIKFTETDGRDFSSMPINHSHVKFTYKKRDWQLLESVQSSNDHETVVSHLKARKSLMISSRAGTGKSFIINKVAERMDVVKIAYTNKAANNIDGMTIHKFLAIDQEGNPNLEGAIQSSRSLSAIIIDEFSLIPIDIWFMLYKLKRIVNIPFLVCGDFRQLPPVENGVWNADYSQHPNVKFICDYTRTELQFHDKCRYDMTMAAYLEKIVEEKPVQIERVDVVTEGFHICYSNAKRKQINRRLNTTGELIPYTGDEDKYHENIRLAIGTKLLALSTNVKLELIKNETYIVTKIDDKHFYIDERQIPKEKVHSFFCLAYCLTIHKCQGQTVNGILNIHEIDLVRKDKRTFYTAVSRATKLENVRYV